MLNTLYQYHVIEVGYYLVVVLLFDLYVLEFPGTVKYNVLWTGSFASEISCGQFFFEKTTDSGFYWRNLSMLK